MAGNITRIRIRITKQRIANATHSIRITTEPAAQRAIAAAVSHPEIPVMPLAWKQAAEGCRVMRQGSFVMPAAIRVMRIATAVMQISILVVQIAIRVMQISIRVMRPAIAVSHLAEWTPGMGRFVSPPPGFVLVVLLLGME